MAGSVESTVRLRTGVTAKSKWVLGSAATASFRWGSNAMMDSHWELETAVVSVAKWKQAGIAEALPTTRSQSAGNFDWSKTLLPLIIQWPGWEIGLFDFFLQNWPFRFRNFVCSCLPMGLAYGLFYFSYQRIWLPLGFILDKLLSMRPVSIIDSFII